MFVLQPDPYCLPCYRIGPFMTEDITFNSKLPESNYIDQYITKRFGGKDYVYTENGRKAINLALSYYKLAKGDVVTVFTTSGNFYVSSCITSEIEKFCSWSRKIEKHTKVILVNHEFGYPFQALEELKKYGKPIIEDCAHTFFSVDKKNTIGQVGDFVIYSFSKMFPIQIGGLLVSNKPVEIKKQQETDEKTLQYIKNVLSHYIITIDHIIQTRLENYKSLKTKFESLGFSEKLELQEGTVPGVFMFRVDDPAIDLPELKKHFYAHGIQCSIFYNERAFFIPCHQNLTNIDLDYFPAVMEAYLNTI